MDELLTRNRGRITAACQRHGVKRLLVFGSAMTGLFDESRSDVDFLVEFSDDVPDLFDAYFGLKEDLEFVLGRRVDLVAPAALENPYFAESVLANGHELYAA